MAAKFVLFKRADGNKPILINPERVSVALESGTNQVTLLIGEGADRDLRQDVAGDLKSVWEKLTGEPVGLP